MPARRSSKKRLDQLLFEKGLADSLAKAQALILAGEVLAAGRRETKAGRLLTPETPIDLARKGPRYVSRGGEKLAGALDHFGIDPRDLNCIDIGASTGGFSDCLLQRGATQVFCFDVGRGQLDPKIRNDPRVVWRESFHARELTPSLFQNPIDLAVIDVSFISLKKVLPYVVPCLRNRGVLLALIKPQFEANRKDVEGSGVLRDEGKRTLILNDLTTFAEATLGLEEVALAPSVLEGAKGNREVFLHGRR